MYFKKKGGGNVLTKDAFNEIYEFDTKFRRDLTVIVDDVPWNFTSICAKVLSHPPSYLTHRTPSILFKSLCLWLLPHTATNAC